MAGAHVAADRAEGHHDAARHVLAAVVARALDHRLVRGGGRVRGRGRGRIRGRVRGRARGRVRVRASGRG